MHFSRQSRQRTLPGLSGVPWRLLWQGIPGPAYSNGGMKNVHQPRIFSHTLPLGSHSEYDHNSETRQGSTRFLPHDHVVTIMCTLDPNTVDLALTDSTVQTMISYSNTLARARGLTACVFGTQARRRGSRQESGTMDSVSNNH